MNMEVCIKDYPYSVEYDISDMRTHYERGWVGKTVVDDIEIEIEQVNELPAEMFSDNFLRLLREEMYWDVLNDEREKNEFMHIDAEVDDAYERAYR